MVYFQARYVSLPECRKLETHIGGIQEYPSLSLFSQEIPALLKDYDVKTMVPY